MSGKRDYDAVIIGAGIGGLVCGCYLAKAGLKTLIVEKNAQPGGYCTSFMKSGYSFDACGHMLSGLRNGGNISRVLMELNLDKRIKITRFDPQDIIITPDAKISFWNNLFGDNNDRSYSNNGTVSKYPWPFWRFSATHLI